MDELREENALVQFAQKELDLVLEQAKEDGEDGYRMQKAFNEGILNVVRAFAEEGHSGFSAQIAIQMIDRLLRFRPLTVLTLEDDEWEEISEGVFQNKRASSVFKQADRFDGKPYCIDGPDGQFVTLEEYPYSYIGIFKKAEE